MKPRDDVHLIESYISSDDDKSLNGPPSLKEALKRRIHNKSENSLYTSNPCVSHKLSECHHCTGKITKRLFAESPGEGAPSHNIGGPPSQTEGIAGHIQTRTRPTFPRHQRQQDLDDAEYEASIRRCLYKTAKILRITCLVVTPILLFLLFFGPTLYNKLPPIARQISIFVFPSLRLWVDLPSPTRQHPSPSCPNDQKGFFESLFYPFHRLNPTKERDIPSIDVLREEFGKDISAPLVLLDQKNEFKREIINIAEGVFVAIGYGLANCILLQGSDGMVVIDTMESTETMNEVWQAWRQLQQHKEQQNQQVKGIIYTHFHTDHTFGASVLYEPGVTEVHAYWLTRIEMEKVLTVTAGTTYRRSMRQFGVYIHSNDFIHAGIGPYLRYDKDAGIGTILPTHIMKEQRKKIQLAGIHLELIHAPGESRDHIIIWIEKQRILIGADNMYKSLPNIYAIRGTETRNCNDWVASLDLMRSLNPDILILGHTRPLIGASYIHSTLTAYRDAIQFIHDQTVRLMNKGMTLNDIAQTVHLPTHLSSHPFLQPVYGTVPWAVRAIFTHYMGWFSGAPEELSQLSTYEKAEGLQDLAGGFKELLNKALAAMRDERYEWALEVATAAHTLRPNNDLAKEIRILALRALASKQTAATGRNWYLTSALEIEGTARITLSDSQKRQVLHRLTMEQIFALLPVRLNPEAAEALDSAILFKFSEPKKGMPHRMIEEDVDNTEENQCVHFRRGIVYTRRKCEREPDVVVETTSAAWLKILTRETGPVAAAARGEIRVKGSLMLLVRSLAAVELDAD